MNKDEYERYHLLGIMEYINWLVDAHKHVELIEILSEDHNQQCFSKPFDLVFKSGSIICFMEVYVRDHYEEPYKLLVDLETLDSRVQSWAEYHDIEPRTPIWYITTVYTTKDGRWGQCIFTSGSIDTKDEDPYTKFIPRRYNEPLLPDETFTNFYKKGIKS